MGTGAALLAAGHLLPDDNLRAGWPDKAGAPAEADMEQGVGMDSAFFEDFYRKLRIKLAAWLESLNGKEYR